MQFFGLGHNGFSARAAALVVYAAMMIGLAATSADAASKFSAIAVDARNGRMLFSDDGDGIRYPASLTKMMTLYLLFEDLRNGKLRLNSPIRMSARAAAMAPSKLGVKAGATITVEVAIKALVVKSANDVAAAVAENLGGTESAFAKRMTRTARAMGMSRSTFANASGLPNPAQVTTARDMATLGLRLMRDFPQYYPYFRSQSFTYNGRTIRGHNRLLGKFEGTDGIKTGYISASGFNLVTSVRRGDTRLVGVVLGGRSGAARDAFMKKMLTQQMGRATSGRTIAALAGSAKGAIDPVVTAGAAPAKKAKKSLFGKKKAPADPAPETVVAEAPSATPEQGDTEEQVNPQPSETEVQPDASSIRQVEASPKSEAPAPIPQVVESQLVEPQLPASLPFEVKAPAGPVIEPESIATLLPVETGWQIQIGAYSTKKDAQARLQEIRRKAGDILVGKGAQTVAVQKGNAVSYRARFTGFDEKTAKAACKQIEKKNTGCYVLAPAS